jgi:hypothetical protein
MKHIIFISIILLLLFLAWYFIFRKKEKQADCGPKPGAPGKWVCKNGAWVNEPTCGPKPTTGNYKCMAGNWINMDVKSGIAELGNIVLEPLTNPTLFNPIPLGTGVNTGQLEFVQGGNLSFNTLTL